MYKKDNNVDFKTIKGSSFNEMVKYKENFLKMNKGIDEDSLLSIQKFICYNVKDISVSQLRNIYNLILDVKRDGDYSALSLKRIKLAYIAGRTDKYGLKNLIGFLDILFNEVGTDTDKFESLRTYAEALVAYHKYYESFKSN
ncbi:MAG: type III-A CRISPR-associated protein Csm2 [Bacteroidales bacterium]|nr:type III-A CRISPR-associated protein Csm2 [Bacteroidales bacterium]